MEDVAAFPVVFVSNFSSTHPIRVIYTTRALVALRLYEEKAQAPLRRRWNERIHGVVWFPLHPPENLTCAKQRGREHLVRDPVTIIITRLPDLLDT